MPCSGADRTAPLEELPDGRRTGAADAAKQAPHEGHQVLQPQMHSNLPLECDAWVQSICVERFPSPDTEAFCCRRLFCEAWHRIRTCGRVLFPSTMASTRSTWYSGPTDTSALSARSRATGDGSCTATHADEAR